MSLSPAQLKIKKDATRLADQFRSTAAEIDRKRTFPQDHLNELAKAKLTGLLIPKKYGGRQGDLTSLALVCEELGRASGTTALCYLMHACGTALISAAADPAQGKLWLVPAAKGEAIATLAFSERATGAHFYAPEIQAERQNGSFALSGRKSFVTSGGHAHLYPVLVKASGEPGLDILLVDSKQAGVSFQGKWEGVGMTGNSSIEMKLEGVKLPADRLLGKEGTGLDFVFGVVAPTFLAGVAALNVGLAQAALDDSAEHAKTRRHPSGQSLAEVPAIQQHLAEMSILTESARYLVLAATAAADEKSETAMPLVMQAKIAATEAAIEVTNLAMQVCGGQGYSRSMPIERYWRDARAGAVMAPTNEVLKEWVGKILTGLPLF